MARVGKETKSINQLYKTLNVPVQNHSVRNTLNSGSLNRTLNTNFSFVSAEGGITNWTSSIKNK